MAAKPLPIPPDEPELNADEQAKPEPPNSGQESRGSTEGGGPIKVGPGSN